MISPWLAPAPSADYLRRQAVDPGPRSLPPDHPGRPGKPVRVEHEYVSHGALALLAGLDVHTGKVFAATPATTGIKPFMNLIGQVMSPGTRQSRSCGLK